jgi:hypothetical protein
VKVVKNFAYRAGTREWSNRYHFTGGSPSDHTHWSTLFAAIVAAEKLIYGPEVTITECVAYEAGSDLPLFTDSFSQAGTFSPNADDVRMPGDCCYVGVYTTAARSAKNHPVYLFSYWHGVYGKETLAPDVVAPDQATQIRGYQTSWVAGFSDGAVTHVRAGPNGASATDFIVPAVPYIKHRDFPS